jgi:hypothetical protein
VLEQTVMSLKFLIIFDERGGTGSEAHVNVDATKSGAAGKNDKRKLYLYLKKISLLKMKENFGNYLFLNYT